MPTEKPKISPFVWAAAPLLLLAAMVAFLAAAGPKGIFPGQFPPIEELTITQTDLKEGTIELEVTNGGPDPVTIAQVLVDDAYWAFEIEPASTLERLDSATVRLEYPWVEGEPFEIALVTETGLLFSHTIDVATETPRTDGRFLLSFALLGIYIGVIPVVLGMGWLPAVRRLSSGWVVFFMALTAGVLIFLGAEALAEAVEQSQGLPSALGGTGVVLAGAVGSFLLILAGARWMRRRAGADARYLVAVTVAIGIGLHNMGEGMAVGAAYRLGEISLGAFLVIGFAIHNVTEGLGIVSILGERRQAFMKLVTLAALAGLPTIIGTWTGAYFFSPLLATVFLAIAAGAIAEVVFDVLSVVKEESGSIASVPSLLGMATGIGVMYATGLFVAA